MAGVNDKYYGEIERGESSPTLERLELISYSLGVDIQQLVGYKPLVPIVIEVQASQEKATNNKTYMLIAIVVVLNLYQMKMI